MIAAILLPAIGKVPSDFFPNLLRIMQWRADILPTFDLPPLYVTPDFFLGLFRLIHIDLRDLRATH